MHHVINSNTQSNEAGGQNHRKKQAAAALSGGKGCSSSTGGGRLRSPPRLGCSRAKLFLLIAPQQPSPFQRALQQRDAIARPCLPPRTAEPRMRMRFLPRPRRWSCSPGWIMEHRSVSPRWPNMPCFWCPARCSCSTTCIIPLRINYNSLLNS